MTAPIDRWAAALWAHYGRIITSGAPLYLAADRWLIGRLSPGHELTKDEDAAVREFHRACLSLLERTDSHATLSNETFRNVPGTSGSRAICLAVQQVLVVERMLNDTKFSANSYFPRYREILELEDTGSRSNPLRGTGFQDIWSALATEILAVKGASQHTITFAPGEGPYLNRHLPMSQALLSAHDLTVIRRATPSLNGRTDQGQMMAALQELRAALGRRAKLLLAAASNNRQLAERICGQVRAFLAWDAAVLSELRPRPTSTELPGLLVAYREQPDLFSLDVSTDTFLVYFRSGNVQLDGAALDSVIKKRLSRQGCLILASDGDAYWELRRQEELGPQEGLLAIVDASNAERFVLMAKEEYRVTFNPVSSNILGSFATLFCDGAGDSLVEQILGRAAPEHRLDLEGGLLVDARSYRYLAGYAPTSLLQRGARVPAETRVTVDGVHRGVGEFIEEIRHQRKTRTYHLQLGSDALECTIVAARPTRAEERALGYPIRAGKLAPSAAEVDPKKPALRGTFFVTLAECRLSERDVSLLANDGDRLAVPERVVAVLLEELRLLSDSNLRARLAARRMASSKSIPVAAVAAGLLKRLSSRSPDYSE